VLRLSVGDAALPVHVALQRFAHAYASSIGATLPLDALQLRDEGGATFDGRALLPCGLPSGSDLFVSSNGVAPVVRSGAASTSAASVTPAAQAALAVTAREGSAIAASQAKMGEHSYYYSVGKAGDPSPAPVCCYSQPRQSSSCSVRPAVACLSPHPLRSGVTPLSSRTLLLLYRKPQALPERFFILCVGQAPVPERRAVTKLDAAILPEATISTFSFMDDVSAT